MGRANTGGGGVNQAFVATGPNPYGVVTDGSHLYWSNFSSGTIGRSNIDGTNVDQSFITGAAAPWGLAVHGGHLYWGNSNVGRVGRARLDGSQVDQAFISNLAFAYGVAVDRNHIYWSTGQMNTIGRANLDGSGVDKAFITGTASGVGLAVSPSHIYWANFNSNSIGRANVDGSGVNQAYITGADGPIGVDVTPTHLYWANRSKNTIGRALLDGTSVRQSFITGANFPVGVTVTLPQSIAFRPVPDTPLNAGPLPLRATASSGLPVAFRSETTDVCVTRGATVVLLRRGRCSISAAQAGSSDYLVAPRAARAFDVAADVTVRAKAKIRKSKLLVDVNPSLGEHWSFAVQVRKKGAWRTLNRQYRTKGVKDRRMVNLPKGRYRVLVEVAEDRTIASAAARLKR